MAFAETSTDGSARTSRLTADESSSRHPLRSAPTSPRERGVLRHRECDRVAIGILEYGLRSG
jgi:hypothetical protein